MSKFWRELWLKINGEGIPVFLAVLPMHHSIEHLLMKVGHKGKWRLVNLLSPHMLSKRGDLEWHLRHFVLPSHISMDSGKWLHDVDTSKHYFKIVRNKKELDRISKEISGNAKAK